MSIEELLKPRYKVIASWPGNNECNVGDIIELPSKEWQYADNGYCDEEYFDTWPHIFQPLKWFEERKDNELPEYIKWNDGETGVFKIHHYYLKGGYVYLSDNETDCISLLHLLPATLTEYENYKQSKQCNS